MPVELKCEQCGKRFFVSPSRFNNGRTPKYCSPKCYHTASRVEYSSVKCLYCGKEVKRDVSHRFKKFCNVECACQYRRSQPKKATLGKSGYRYIWLSDGSAKPEHIYVMEEFLGRPLEKNECVHHIDFNRANNDISNLKLMTRGEHSKFHREYEKQHGKPLFGRSHA